MTLLLASRRRPATHRPSEALIPPAEPVPPLALDYLGIHPRMAEMFTSTACHMVMHDGELFIGYGDWHYNQGPVDVVSIHPTTGQATTHLANVGTESLYQIREFNNALWMPWIDPKGWASGLTTNEGGAWHTIPLPGMAHTFDVNTLTGTDLWVVGSTNLNGKAAAVAYRSLDGGATWELAWSYAPNPSWGAERCYLCPVIGGSIFLEGTGDNDTVHAFNGTNWFVPDPQPPRRWLANGLRTLHRDGVCYTSQGALLPDLTAAPNSTATHMILSAVDGDYIYALSDIGRTPILWRSPGVTDGEVPWEPVGSFDGMFFATVANSVVYVGFNDGRIYAGALP